MYKPQVGDILTLRKDLVSGQYYGDHRVYCSSDMASARGKSFKVTSVCTYSDGVWGVHLKWLNDSDKQTYSDIEEYVFVAEMFDLPLVTTKITKPTTINLASPGLIKKVMVNTQRKKAGKGFSYIGTVLTVVFTDGTVIMPKCNIHDNFDVNVGVALALAQYLYGSKNNFHKMVNNCTTYIETTKKGKTQQ